MTEKKQYPRSKLQITEVAAEPKSFGDKGGQVLNFKANITGPEGNPYLGQTFGFGCFKKDLFETIKAAAVGVTLDCDFETKPYQAQDGERLNFNINQIYVDGQPVSVKKGYPGSYGNADSPEKRKSIEDQYRAGRITELWIAGKLPDDDSLVTKLRTWLDELGSPVVEKKATPPTEKKAEPAKSTKTTESPSTESEDWAPLKDLGQLYTRAAKFGISTRDVCESVGVGKGEDIIDFDEAWEATAKKFAPTIKAAQEAK